MATTPVRKTAAKPRPAKRAARKATPRARAGTPDSRANGQGTTQVVARRVISAGLDAGHKVRGLAGQAGRAVDTRSRQAARFLAEHPKVAASLAAGIITVGSALLARKLKGKALPGRVDAATHKIAEVVQGLLK